jgi:4-phytase/acid phosphatase
MKRPPTLAAFGIVCAVATLSVGSPAIAAPKQTLILERTVLVTRHGIRAPLDGEVPPGTRTGG